MSKKAFFNLLNEFSPALGFFVSAQFFTFYTATSILMVMTVIALLAGWYFDRHLPVLPIISGFFVIISGFITITYKTPDALIFADSLYYFLMGLTIAFGLVLNKNILKLIFSRVLAMTDSGWKILTIRWIVVFLLAGSANEIVRVFATPEIWIKLNFLK